MVISIRKIALAFVFFTGSFAALFAQPVVQSGIDTKQILIGQQINLKVVADLPAQDFYVKWVEVPDSLQHFELVQKSKIDSVFKNQKLTRLSQTFTFTSFDSGKWTLPAFDIHFNPSSGGEAYNRFTDTFSIDVSYQADSTNALRDIKDIREAAPFSLLQVLLIIIIGGLIALALLGWLIYYLVKRSRRKKTVAQKSVSPYHLAVMELEKLKGLNLSDPNAVRTYHTRLKEILKTYLSSVHGADFISSTTAEVLMLLNQQGINKEAMSQIAETLRRSDAARFAKYIPSISESEQSWLVIKQAINFTEQLQKKTEQNGA